MFKKIVLCEPKAPNDHVYSLVNMPRLGLPLIGTHLREHGYDVTLLYGSSQDIRIADLVNADLVGISTTTSTSTEAYLIAHYARERGIPVVMGGPHATFMVAEALQHCDYVCRGEADFTFTELVRCLENGEIPLHIPGVSFWHKDSLIENPLPAPVEVETCVTPDLSLFKSMKKISTFPVMTSRGCPFDCTFCSVTAMFGRRYRYRNTEQTLAELQAYSNKKVFFCDDNFTANPARSKELLRGMIASGHLPKLWGAQVRTDTARDDELLELMKAAGCQMVYVGLESINPLTLASYNKKQSVEDIEHCIRKFHDYGIMVHGMFVFGSDEDTVQTIRDTVTFALDTKIDTVQFLVLTPIPGTSCFQQIESEGRLLTRDWRLYDGHHVVHRPQLMSPLELQVETIQGFKRFYSLRNLPGNTMLTGKRSMAFRAAGYWLVRKWERENRWYYQTLASLAGEPIDMSNQLNLHKTVETIKLKHFHYLATERLLDLRICEENGTFLIELKGYLNNFTLRETFRTLRNNIPGRYRELTININHTCFASEEVIKKFIQEVNHLSLQVKHVRLKADACRSALHRVLEKYNLNVPCFELGPLSKGTEA